MFGGRGHSALRRFARRDRRGIEGDDDLELGDEVARAAFVPGRARGGGRPDSGAGTALLIAQFEDCTPTRVMPSMSFSAVTKPATASWPAAQPVSSRAGSGAEARRLPTELVSPVTSDVAVR